MAGRDDRVFVRAHLRRRPRPGGGAAPRGSGWLIAGVVAALWLWSRFVGFSDTPPAAPPPTPAATAVPGAVSTGAPPASTAATASAPASAPASASASTASVPAEIGAP